MVIAMYASKFGCPLEIEYQGLRRHVLQMHYSAPVQPDCYDDICFQTHLMSGIPSMHARKSLRPSNAVAGAIEKPDIRQLSALRDSGQSFDTPEMYLHLVRSVLGGQLATARFLVENGCAKWLSIIQQKEPLLDALKQADFHAAWRILSRGVAIKGLVSMVSKKYTQFMNNVREPYVLTDYTRWLRLELNFEYPAIEFENVLERLGSVQSVVDRAFQTIEDLSNYKKPQDVSQVLGFFLVANSINELFPQEFGDKDLFFKDIDRWREHTVPKRQVPIFDEIVRKAWGKRSIGSEDTEFDFDKINENLRKLIQRMLGMSPEVYELQQRQSAPLRPFCAINNEQESPRPPRPEIEKNVPDRIDPLVRRSVFILLTGFACVAFILWLLFALGGVPVSLQLNGAVHSYSVIQRTYFKPLSKMLMLDRSEINEVTWLKLNEGSLKCIDDLEWCLVNELPNYEARSIQTSLPQWRTDLLERLDRSRDRRASYLLEAWLDNFPSVVSQSQPAHVSPTTTSGQDQEFHHPDLSREAAAATPNLENGQMGSHATIFNSVNADASDSPYRPNDTRDAEDQALHELLAPVYNDMHQGNSPIGHLNSAGLAPHTQWQANQPEDSGQGPRSLDNNQNGSPGPGSLKRKRSPKPPKPRVDYVRYDPILTGRDSDEVQCPITQCNKILPNMTSYRTHLKEEHLEPQEVGGRFRCPAQVYDKNGRSLDPLECPASFKTKATCAFHIKEQHVPPEDNVICTAPGCDFYLNSFRRPYQYKEHQSSKAHRRALESFNAGQHR